MIKDYESVFIYMNIYNLTGKKGGSEPEKDDAPPGEAIIPTLPDVKMCAAKAIARSARSGRYLNWGITELRPLNTILIW